MENYTVIQDGVEVMNGIDRNMAIIVGLTSNTNYRFQVQAINNAGDGQASNANTFTTSNFVYIFFYFIYLTNKNKQQAE